MAMIDLSGGYSQGGSAQTSWSNAQGSSYSETDASAAREWSAQQAQIARDWQEAMMEKQMQFNSAEAAKEREWQQNNIDIANEMANTVYTRAATNMKEAGINPILAYTAGLGGVGAGVTSGSTAATSALPSGAMGQSFMDQHSASQSSSKGGGNGSSWNESQSGLATGLQLLGNAIGGALEKIGAAQKIDIAINGLKDLAKTGDTDKAYSKAAETIAEATGTDVNKVKDTLMTKDSGRYKAQSEAMKKQKNYFQNRFGRMNEASWGN